jgi:hypothetical protein
MDAQQNAIFIGEASHWPLLLLLLLLLEEQHLFALFPSVWISTVHESCL